MFKHDPVIYKTLKKHKNPVYAARSLVFEINKCYYVFGGILAKMKEDNYQETLGYGKNFAGFHAFVCDYISPMSGRTIYSYIEAYQKCRNWGITSRETLTFDYSFLRYMPKNKTKDIEKRNKKEMLIALQTLSKREFSEFIVPRMKRDYARHTINVKRKLEPFYQKKLKEATKAIGKNASENEKLHWLLELPSPVEERV